MAIDGLQWPRLLAFVVVVGRLVGRLVGWLVVGLLAKLLPLPMFWAVVDGCAMSMAMSMSSRWSQFKLMIFSTLDL